MKHKLFLPMAVVILAGLMITPGCKSFVWDVTGQWTLTVNDSYGFLTAETVTFSGSEDAGTTSAYWDFDAENGNGTYTKTGDYSVMFNISYFDPVWGPQDWSFNGTSSEASPNTMTGSGTWNDAGYSVSITFNATKISNLQ